MKDYFKNMKDKRFIISIILMLVTQQFTYAFLKLFQSNFHVFDHIIDMKIPFIDTIDEYIFDKEKFFNQTVNEENKDKEGKNVKQLIGMDSYGNIHLFDYNFNYVVLLIKNHNNNNNNENNNII